MTTQENIIRIEEQIMRNNTILIDLLSQMVPPDQKEFAPKVIKVMERTEVLVKEIKSPGVNQDKIDK